VDDTRSAALESISAIRARSSSPVRTPNERDAELEELRMRLETLEAEVRMESP
jgi:hypothetical protein